MKAMLRAYGEPLYLEDVAELASLIHESLVPLR
jgi:hypothetical protein